MKRALVLLAVALTTFASVPSASAATCSPGPNGSGAVAGGYADYDEAYVAAGPAEVECHYGDLREPAEAVVDEAIRLVGGVVGLVGEVVDSIPDCSVEPDLSTWPLHGEAGCDDCPPNQVAYLLVCEGGDIRW